MRITLKTLSLSAIAAGIAITGIEAWAAPKLVVDATHVIVRHEKGRCFGWPANGGIWSWGNEMLVQYKHGEFQDKPVGSHDINYGKPIVLDQSRSLDGGLTWTHHATTLVSSEDDKSPIPAPTLTTPIDFSRPDTILKFDWAGSLYYSIDRGVKWRGPFSLPKLGMHTWQLRTDYLVEDKNTVLAFCSGSKEKFKRDENGGMVYMLAFRRFSCGSCGGGEERCEGGGNFA